MINYHPISTCARNIFRMSGRVQRQMSRDMCSSVSQGPSNSFSFYCYKGHSKPKHNYISLSETFSCSSTTGFQTFKGNCFLSGFVKRGGVSRSLTVKSLVGSRGPSKRSLDISLTCQNMNVRLLVPKQGLLPKIKCNVGSVYWPQGCASAGLMFALLVCYSSSEPVHAESTHKKEDECYAISHGKKVYTDYSITGGKHIAAIPGDGRCLFRSVVHGACLRSGKPAPSESRQKELADELRAEVVDELVRRRSETEWFVEGDFDTYVSQMRKPHAWGGEPELFIASHVLQMPITVYMYDRDSGGLITIAEYGQEYGKENPIRVLYHGFGHYESLQIPGKKGTRSRL